jgi:hypothetical protein
VLVAAPAICPMPSAASRIRVPAPAVISCISGSLLFASRIEPVVAARRMLSPITGAAITKSEFTTMFI